MKNWRNFFFTGHSSERWSRDWLYSKISVLLNHVWNLPAVAVKVGLRKASPRRASPVTPAPLPKIPFLLSIQSVLSVPMLWNSLCQGFLLESSHMIALIFVALGFALRQSSSLRVKNYCLDPVQLKRRRVKERIWTFSHILMFRFMNYATPRWSPVLFTPYSWCSSFCLINYRVIFLFHMVSYCWFYSRSQTFCAVSIAPVERLFCTAWCVP